MTLVLDVSRRVIKKAKNTDGLQLINSCAGLLSTTVLDEVLKSCSYMPKHSPSS